MLHVYVSLACLKGNKANVACLCIASMFERKQGECCMSRRMLSN